MPASRLFYQDKISVNPLGQKINQTLPSQYILFNTGYRSEDNEILMAAEVNL